MTPGSHDLRNHIDRSTKATLESGEPRETTIEANNSVLTGIHERILKSVQDASFLLKLNE
jgi:hypothetical protein